jgi:hypothetical protein
VAFHRVANHDGGTDGQGLPFEPERAAIQQNGGAFRGMPGDELVHNANLHADKFAFRALAEQRDTSAVETDIRDGEERNRNHGFERGGRAQSGADWNFTVDHEIRTLELDAFAGRGIEHAGDVIAPMSGVD